MMDTTWFDDAINRIDAVSTCPDLTRVVGEINGKIAALEANITAEIARLAPLLAVPTDLPSLLTWAGNIVTTYVVPHAALLANAATVTSKAAQVATAAAAKAARLGC